MATTARTTLDPAPRRPDEPRTVSRPASTGNGQTPAGRRWLLRGAILAVVVLLAVTGYVQLGGALDSDAGGPMLTYTVQRGELVVTVTEDGNVESAQNVDIKCAVAGGSTILAIVEDGTVAKKDDVLVRLDSSALEEQINQQKITYETARAAMIQADNDFEVAKISVQEYEEGNYVQQLQDLEANVTVALENLRSAENMLVYTQRMFRKGYVSPLSRETQKFAVERSRLELASARTAKNVLEKFTKRKTLQELHSQRDTAEATMLSEKAAFALEELKLKRLEGQLERCEIRAPQDGMVVYANDMGRMRMGGQQSVQIEEGATVRERQTILRLPDLTRMQVKVAVHESRVDQIRRGMRARIRIQDREFQGTVTSISNQPEATNFFAANVKEYSTIVKIDGNPQGLRPGMTAEVEILVEHLTDVLSLPVAAVVEQGGTFFAWVRTPEGIERRPLVLEISNQKFIEVKDGVVEGEQVVLNPRAMIEAARGESFDRRDFDVQEKFGSAADTSSGEGANSPPSGHRPDGATGRDGARPGDPAESGRRRGGGMGRSFDLMQFDSDGDGKVSKDEMPEQMQNFFDRLDSDGDGFIDSAEIKAMQERMQQRGGAGGGQHGGGRGEGGRPGGQRGPGRGASDPSAGEAD